MDCLNYIDDTAIGAPSCGFDIDEWTVVRSLLGFRGTSARLSSVNSETMLAMVASPKGLRHAVLDLLGLAWEILSTTVARL
eukprot:441186-Pyramimonas_sp.AAC.1